MENKLMNEQKKEEKEFLDIAYAMHYQYPFKMKAILSILALLTIGICMMFGYGTNIAWYLKGGVLLLYLFFLLKKFYDYRYYLGVKKNLFIIDEVNDTYSYYNEFEGVKTFKLNTMKRIKIFRNKTGIHLIEIITNDGKREQNINVQCLSQEDIHDMVLNLRRLYPEVEYAENLPPYEVAKAQKEAEKQAKKEKYQQNRKK